jgi:sugar phosphate isomerase/epimerase
VTALAVQLAFSTNAFKRFPLEHAIRSIAQAGYDGVELLCDVPHAYPPAFGDGQIDDTKRLLAELGIRISNLNTFTLYAIGDIYHPSWIEPDEERRKERLQHTLNCIEMAKKLGARNLSTEPGGPLNGTGMDRKTAAKVFLKNIKVVQRAAEEAGVRILIEPEPGLMLEDSAQFLDFMRDVPSDCVGLNFDIGHFYCVGEKPEELIYRMADYIGHFHLEDIAADRVHQHLIPGKGDIDFSAVFRAIDGVGYRGFVTVELYPYQDDPVSAAREAFEYLQNVR